MLQTKSDLQAPSGAAAGGAAHDKPFDEHTGLEGLDVSSLLPGWMSAAGIASASREASASNAAGGASTAVSSSATAKDTARLALPPSTEPAAMNDRVAPASVGAKSEDLPGLAATERGTAKVAEHRAFAVDLQSPPPATAPNTLHTPSTAAPASPAGPTAHVAAPIDTPAFAPTLATQVRWLVQDGVQQAQLTLNPPEMGPVAVQITVLEGREARIDFSADLAATRQAIEASLPVLAAALDDSGLRLAGGGVHDGQAGRHPAWATPARTGTQRIALHGSEESVTAVGGAPRAAAGRGLIDLLA